MNTNYKDTVRFTKFTEYEGKLLAHAVIYLRDTWSKTDSEIVTFGRRESVAIPLDANEDEQIEALNTAKEEILNKFNAKTSSLNNGIELTDEQLNKLAVLELPGTYKNPEDAVKG